MQTEKVLDRSAISKTSRCRVSRGPVVSAWCSTDDYGIARSLILDLEQSTFYPALTPRATSTAAS